jgi:acyl CoA:acetate/3-ketoacid CoA transferase alpha subunit
MAGAILIAGADPIAMMLWSQAVLAAMLRAPIEPLPMIMASRRVGCRNFAKNESLRWRRLPPSVSPFDGAFVVLMMRPWRTALSEREMA